MCNAQILLQTSYFMHGLQPFLPCLVNAEEVVGRKEVQGLNARLPPKETFVFIPIRHFPMSVRHKYFYITTPQSVLLIELDSKQTVFAKKVSSIGTLLVQLLRHLLQSSP